MNEGDADYSLGAGELDERRPGELPCPVCREPMHVEKKQDVEVDVCSRHGIWLDKDELDGIGRAIRARARASERAMQRVAVRKAKSDGKLLGAFFGWWSLLFD